jgi:hypothetical protein
MVYGNRDEASLQKEARLGRAHVFSGEHNMASSVNHQRWVDGII